MDEAMIVLPGSNEIFSRLRSIAGNTAELNKFYMRLFKYAGLEYCVYDLVTMVISEIEEHTSNMTTIDIDILLGEAPKFIDALVEDPLSAKVAKTAFQKRMLAAWRYVL